MIRSNSSFAVLSRSNTKGTKDFLVHNHNTVHKFTKNKIKSYKTWITLSLKEILWEHHKDFKFELNQTHNICLQKRCCKDFIYILFIQTSWSADFSLLRLWILKSSIYRVRPLGGAINPEILGDLVAETGSWVWGESFPLSPITPHPSSGKMLNGSKVFEWQHIRFDTVCPWPILDVSATTKKKTMFITSLAWWWTLECHVNYIAC